MGRRRGRGEGGRGLGAAEEEHAPSHEEEEQDADDVGDDVATEDMAEAAEADAAADHDPGRWNMSDERPPTTTPAPTIASLATSDL